MTCLGFCLVVVEGGGGGGRGMLPSLLFSLFKDLLQRNFVQGLTIKALAQIWEKFE